MTSSDFNWNVPCNGMGRRATVVQGGQEVCQRGVESARCTHSFRLLTPTLGASPPQGLADLGYTREMSIIRKVNDREIQGRNLDCVLVEIQPLFSSYYSSPSPQPARVHTSIHALRGSSQGYFSCPALAVYNTSLPIQRVICRGLMICKVPWVR